VADVSLGSLLGTGALVAAVIGLSMQGTLGNIFAGLSLSLDRAFEVGDWLEISGYPLGSGRGIFIGRVEAMTWRAVQLVSWDGDTDLVPNRIIAQSVITNLYAPAGLHRRTAFFTIQPTARLHETLQLLTVALAGIPHLPEKRPKAVAHGQHEGGVQLEVQWWTLGFRHRKASTDEVNRLVPTVLTREGFPLMGPDGPSTHPLPRPEADEAMLAGFVRHLGLPEHWAAELKSKVRAREFSPGEGVLREGDPGDSLFAIVSGQVNVVRALERSEPYTGLFWELLAELGPGQCLGESSLLTGAPRNATVVTKTACVLLEMDKAAFESSLKREPQVLEHLAQLLEARAPEAARAAAESSGPIEQWRRQIKAWFGIE
jgi:CRP-like cAMP-binding protein